MTIQIEIGIKAKVADHGGDKQLAWDVKHAWVREGYQLTVSSEVVEMRYTAHKG